MTIVHGSRIVASLAIGALVVTSCFFLPIRTGIAQTGVGTIHDDKVEIKAQKAADSFDFGADIIPSGGGDKKTKPASKSIPTPPSDSPRPFDNKLRSEIEKAILRELSEDSRIDFLGETIGGAIGFWKEYHEINLHLDQTALEDLGLTSDSQIPNISLSGTPLKDCLALVLEPLGLTYTIKHNVLLITSMSREETLVETRVYKYDKELGVRLTPNLIEMITTLIEPESWEDTGGVGSIVGIENGFAVSQSFHVHEQIHELLTQLKRNSENTRK